MDEKLKQKLEKAKTIVDECVEIDVPFLYDRHAFRLYVNLKKTDIFDVSLLNYIKDISDTISCVEEATQKRKNLKKYVNAEYIIEQHGIYNDDEFTRVRSNIIRKYKQYDVDSVMKHFGTEHISKTDLPHDFTSFVDGYMTELKQKETTHIKSTDVDILREKWKTHYDQLPERRRVAIDNAIRIAEQVNQQTNNILHDLSITKLIMNKKEEEKKAKQDNYIQRVQDRHAIRNKDIRGTVVGVATLATLIGLFKSRKRITNAILFSKFRKDIKQYKTCKKNNKHTFKQWYMNKKKTGLKNINNKTQKKLEYALERIDKALQKD